MEGRGGAATLVVLLAAFLLASAMHRARGAFDSGFGWADDEAAHMVSGVMVHDYLSNPDPADPTEYAKDYYTHYPKVAIGQWPPCYHALQALWTLCFGVSRESIVLLGAALSAAIAALVFRALRPDVGRATALAAAGLFLLLPLVQRFGAMAMTELLLTLACFCATLAFGRFLDRARLRDALAFALFASLAILTKANGLALALLPPIAIVLTRRWRLLRCRTLWIAAGVVALLAAPWTVLFLPVNRSTWGGGSSANLEYTLRAVPVYARAAVEMGGALVLLLAVWGAWTRRGGGPRTGLWTATIAWCMAMPLFHVLVPSSVESRHLVLVAPQLCMLAGVGVHDLASRVRPLGRSAGAVAAAALLVGFLPLGWSFPRKGLHGYRQAVEWIESKPELDGLAVLVDSGSIGEGLAVSEFVLAADERPDRYVLRATKLLSQSTWTGREYRATYRTTEEMARALARLPVGLVLFVHSLDPRQTMEHHVTLHRMLELRPEWTRLAVFDVRRDDMDHPEALELWRQEGVQRGDRLDLDFARLSGRDLPFASE